jgi:hypothetical protein
LTTPKKGPKDGAIVKFDTLTGVTRLRKWTTDGLPGRHVYIMPWDIRRIEEGAGFTTVICRDCAVTIHGDDTEVARQIFWDMARLQASMLVHFITEKRQTPWMQEIAEMASRVAVAKALNATEEQIKGQLPDLVKAALEELLAKADAEKAAP